MRESPDETLTFLFTDIEGSTRLWEAAPEAMQTALLQHDAILRATLETRGGHIFKTLGDAFCAAFADPLNALRAALSIQKHLDAQTEGEPGTEQSAAFPVTLKVRMALHTGAAEERDGDYYGAPLNRTARLLAAAHGGQVLVSQTTAEQLPDDLPEAIHLHDLGIHRLKDLLHPERIFQMAHPDLLREFPPLRSLDYLPNNLPHQLTSFVGREQETEDIRQLIRSTRMVTLTGVGGCGKTRLAVQVAADLLEEFPDGVWLVDFAVIADAALIVQTTAAALELSEEPGKPLRETLLESLPSRQILLLLDNCEHLLPSLAPFAQELLHTGPKLRVLATSREALRIPGETAWRVPPMSAPDGETPLTLDELNRFEAIRLFVERITAIQPNFTLTEQNAPFVRQICVRLDGLPLAIELAAARARVLSLEQLAARLDDRFRLLAGGSRTALPRQQTLRALIDWSYDLLTEPEKTLFRRLSVFAGGWMLDTAETVCADTEKREAEKGKRSGDKDEKAPGDSDTPEKTLFSFPSSLFPSDIPALLTSLVEKSLVLCEETSAGIRYRLLETIRQYARERLIETGEETFLQRKHSEALLHLAEEAATPLAAGDRVWIARIEMEYDNLRAAQNFSEESVDGGEAGLRIAVALLWYWFGRGCFTEGSERLERALQHGAEADIGLRARALNGMGAMAHGVGDFGRAAELHEQALAIYRETGERRGIAFSLTGLGTQQVCLCRFEVAVTTLEEALKLAREIEDRWCIGLILLNLAEAVWHLDQPARSESLCTECLQIGMETDNALWRAYALNGLGAAAVFRGDTEAARRSYTEALRLFCEIGDQRNIAYSLEGFARIATVEGQFERVARLFGATEALREIIRSPWTPPDRIVYAKYLARLRESLSAETFLSLWAEGRSLSLEQVIAFAMERSDSESSES